MEGGVAVYPVERCRIVYEVGGARGGSAAVPGAFIGRFLQKGVQLRYMVGRRVEGPQVGRLVVGNETCEEIGREGGAG
jgi:hypothetical protein